MVSPPYFREFYNENLTQRNRAAELQEARKLAISRLASARRTLAPFGAPLAGLAALTRLIAADLREKISIAIIEPLDHTSTPLEAIGVEGLPLPVCHLCWFLPSLLNKSLT